MRALVWTGAEQMVIEEREQPRVQEGWVLVHIAAVGVCGSELSGYMGHNSLRVPPLIMGHEFSGTLMTATEEWPAGQLVTVNPLVTCGHCRYCREGNRQLCVDRKIIGIDYPGGFAEFVAVPAQNCYPVSSPEAGAIVEPLACAVRATRLAEVEAGDRAVVYGAGTIGLLAVRLLVLRGVQEIAVVDTNQDRLTLAAEWGATSLKNPADSRTKPLGADWDVVIDAVGAASTRQNGLSAVRRGGHVVWLGLHEADSTIAANAIVRDEVQIRGSFCYADDDFRRAVLLAQDRAIVQGRWLVHRRVEEGVQEFHDQTHKDVSYSKALLTFNSQQGGQ